LAPDTLQPLQLVISLFLAGASAGEPFPKTAIGCNRLQFSVRSCSPCLQNEPTASCKDCDDDESCTRLADCPALALREAAVVTTKPATNRSPFMPNEPTASCGEPDDDARFTRSAECRALTGHDVAGRSRNGGLTQRTNRVLDPSQSKALGAIWRRAQPPSAPASPSPAKPKQSTALPPPRRRADEPLGHD
jgi:hypothetical protein